MEPHKALNLVVMSSSPMAGGVVKDLMSRSVSPSRFHWVVLALMEGHKALNLVVMGSSPLVGHVVMDVMSRSVSQCRHHRVGA